MSIENLSPTTQARIESWLGLITTLGTRIVVPQLLALDWLIAQQERFSFAARQVHDQVVRDVTFRDPKDTLKFSDDVPATVICNDPRMDGETWTPAADLTDTLVCAWPLWERLPDPQGTAVPELFGAAIWTFVSAGGGKWRPLRLPGMNPITGMVAAKDMTPEHFRRCKWLRARHWGSDWEPAITEWTTVMDVDGGGTRFRPVAWPDVRSAQTAERPAVD